MLAIGLIALGRRWSACSCSEGSARRFVLSGSRPRLSPRRVGLVLAGDSSTAGSSICLDASISIDVFGSATSALDRRYAVHGDLRTTVSVVCTRSATPSRSS